MACGWERRQKTAYFMRGRKKKELNIAFPYKVVYNIFILREQREQRERREQREQRKA